MIGTVTITGCEIVYERNGWTILHDLRDRSVFCCKRGIIACRAMYHQGLTGFCHGARYTYGRWYNRRSPRRAFELALEWIGRQENDNPARNEIAERAELEKVLESL